MNSIRKWIFRPKRSDTAYLAQFYYADEELNLVAAELDSFDGRKDPERCTSLVNQLRRCQDAVLGIVEKMMTEMIPYDRASRDYRVKFPEDVLQESLAGQLWFGAECLAAGSSILNHEVESASMRPLAKTLTQHLDQLRSLLREQALKNQNTYNDKIIEALIEFDKLFAEFELSYVSAMVPVKTMREHDLLQEVMVLFCETVQRALKLHLLSQDQIDAYDPALMFTIPRLAIVCGLLVYPEGPLNPDMDPLNMSEMFRPFQTLLFKIRELLWTLSREELWLLEKSLCSTDEGSLVDLTALQTEMNYHRPQPIGCDSPSTPVDSEPDEGDQYPGVMVHSDSTMTVVAHSDCGLAAASAPETAVAEEGELGVDKNSLQNTAYGDLVEGSAPGCPAQFTRGSREFNFNLPFNTGSQEAINTPVSLEVSLAHVPDACFLQSRKPGFIYITNSEDEEENRDTAQQISFITDAFCQLFNPSMPIGNAVMRLKSNISWSERSSVIRDGDVNSNNKLLLGGGAGHDGSCRNNDDHLKMESSVGEREGVGRRPTSYRRWYSSPAGVTSCTGSNDQDFSCDTIAQNSENRLPPDSVLPKLPHVFSPGTDPSDLSANREVPIASSANSTIVGTKDASGNDCIASDIDHLVSISSSEVCEVDDTSSVSNEEQILRIMKESLEVDSETQAQSAFARVPGNGEAMCRLNDVPETVIEDSLDSTTMAAVAPAAMVQNFVFTGYPQDSSLPLDSCAASEIKHCDRKVVGASGGKRKVYARVCNSEDYGQEFSSGQFNRTAGTRPTSFGPKTEAESLRPLTVDHNNAGTKSLDYDWDRESSETSSYTSENHDDEEIAMAIQAAEVAARNEARSRFRSSTDLIHRLFVCISGVADQLQTNYASDLRHILKAVFECFTLDVTDKPAVIDSTAGYIDGEAEDEAENSDISNPRLSGVEVRPRGSGANVHSSSCSSEPPQWIPDEQSSYCMSCRVSFTFVRRRHHCRNCGKLFCSHCSANSVPLPNFGHTKPVRVCNHCYMFRVTPFTTAH